VQLSQPVERTPDAIVNRYRVNRNWRLYEKEWIYRNFPPAGRSWLDFGCGTGEIATQLAVLGASRVLAVDVSPGLVEMTRCRVALDGVSDRVQALCGDLGTLDPEPVDIALSFAVVHHVPDHLPRIIALLRKWLKPGGTILCVEPVCYLPWIEWIRQRSGVSQDPVDSGERKLTEADLRIIERESHISRRVHFHTFARFGRMLPAGDHLFRYLDAIIGSLPGARWLAGTVIVACQF